MLKNKRSHPAKPILFTISPETYLLQTVILKRNTFKQQLKKCYLVLIQMQLTLS
jgi:hypothetical protein